MTEAHAQLRRLSTRLLNLQEKERERISRELHDHFGQLLTAIGMNLDWVLYRCPENAHPIAERLHETRQLTQEVIAATRQLSATLRPGELRGLGLEAALHEYLSEFERRSGLLVHFSSTVSDHELTTEATTNIYRIVQEALTNVVRYADASEVQVRLEYLSGRLIVSVNDDGKGFDTNQVMDPHAVGLIGMQERARLLNGTCEIRSVLGAGTVIRIVVPLPEESHMHDYDTPR